MKNHVYWCVAIIIYIMVIILLLLKARDIFNNTSKYCIIKGWDKYRKSFWYAPQSERHGKNYWAPIIVGIPLYVALIVVFWQLSFLIQKFVFIPQDALYLHGEGLAVGALGMAFFAIVLEFWILFHGKSPIVIACTRRAFNSFDRSGDWKKLVCMMLIFSVLCLPVMFAGIDSYAYASNKEIVINDTLKMDENHISYEDIELVETNYRSNKDQTEFYFSYIIKTKDKEKIDVLKYCSSKELLYIHDFIEDKNITMKKGMIQNSMFVEMREVINTYELEIVREMFEIIIQ